jgi:bacteriophage CI repressor helix-turn-helix domain
MSEICHRIVSIRKSFGLNQSDFAANLEINRTTLASYEKGISSPSVTFLLKIKEVYKININWLLTGEGEMFIAQGNNTPSIESILQADNNGADDLADEIRQTRRKMGKTQKEIAALLGIPQTTWSNYEIGKAKPPLKILMQLADLGYAIPGFSNNVILGNNNTQIGNNNHIVQTPDNSSPQYTTNEHAELIELLCNYAPPKMLKELKTKLLKIKEMADNATL